MGTFNAKILAEFQPPRKWKLGRDLTYSTKDLMGDEIKALQDIGVKVNRDTDISPVDITVPTEFMTDLASTPRALWAFIAPFDVARAAIVHDLLYKTIRQYRWNKGDIEEDKEEVNIDEHCDISRPTEKKTVTSDIADVTILNTLNDMYKKTKPIIQFGEDVDDITFAVEIPEYEKVYNIDVQTNDLLDELLSAIPEDKMTHTIENNIHNLIERFKQLRTLFSEFDEKMNVKNHLYKGIIHKPLVNKILNLEKNIEWIIPVVSQKKKFYGGQEMEDMSSDKIELILKNTISSWLECVDLYKSHNTSNRYLNYVNDLNNFMMPFTSNSNDNNFDLFFT